jgi:hypothetical protein
VGIPNFPERSSYGRILYCYGILAVIRQHCSGKISSSSTSIALLIFETGGNRIITSPHLLHDHPFPLNRLVMLGNGGIEQKQMVIPHTYHFPTFSLCDIHEENTWLPARDGSDDGP